MGARYSLDLRKRVVAAVAGGMSRAEAAAHYQISHSSAIRWRGGWCCGVGFGLVLPPVVVAPAPVYVAPPAYYPPPAAYYPPGHVWVPAHWEGGYWVPGHWS